MERNNKFLEKYPEQKLLELIEVIDERGRATKAEQIEGVNIEKDFARSVANLENSNLSKYKTVPVNAFACNLMHVGRDITVPVAFNSMVNYRIVSPAYTVFKVKDEGKLLPLFLFTQLNSKEFDRKLWFNTDGSVRGNLSWEDMCRVKIPLPPIEVQRAYVKAYQGLSTLIEQNEALVKELEKTAQACIVECREKWPMVEIGERLKRLDIRNSDSKVKDVKGLSVSKQFREPTSKVDRENLASYKVVENGQFAFVQTTNNEKCLVVCLSSYKMPIVVSSVNEVFEIEDTTKLLPEYLFLQFKRPEFDRYARFNSWGSARETFTWEDMCRVKIPLPPIEVQRAYVKAYQGLSTLIEQNEALVKELEKTAQACVVEGREKWSMVEIGQFIEQRDERNTGEEVSISQGISNLKFFQEPKQVSSSPKTDKIVRTGYFAYNRATTRNGEKISIALRERVDCTVSSAYCVFEVIRKDKLNPQFLLLWFKRSEFDRYARYHSKGSAHEFFEWEDMCRVKIPLPPIEVQRAIVALYTCAEEARKIAAEARELLKKACPAMVQSAAHHKVGVFQ